MSTVALPVSTPTEHGVDPQGILDLIDAVEAAPDQEPHSLMVLRHGAVIAQGWWAPYSADGRQLVYSLSKSFTSTAAGLAVAEGLIDLDATAISYFPEYASEITDPRARGIRLRHLLSMSTGHSYDTADEALARDPQHPVRGFLTIAPEQAPGTVFAYNQPATYTLAAIIQKRAGQTLLEYLRPRVLDPLGIAPLGWQQYPAGRNLGFTGLFATTDAIAKLGQLYLRRGEWDGQQILPAAWVDRATQAHIATAEPFGGDGAEASPDWSCGYGFQFWMSRHGFRGDGAFGQFCLVLPEQDAVLAYTGQTENLQGTLDAVWRHLLPAFDRAGGSTDASGGDSAGEAGAAAAQDALGARLASLALPVPRFDPAPETTVWDDATLDPEDETCLAEPSLIAVRTRRVGDGFRITLTDTTGDHEVALGVGEWALSGPEEPTPMAVSGGWDEAGRLHLDVALIETPHRLHVICDALDGTFTASWQTEPLRFPPTAFGDFRTPAPLG